MFPLFVQLLAVPNISLTGWREDCARYHEETIARVEETAHQQVEFNIQGVCISLFFFVMCTDLTVFNSTLMNSAEHWQPKSECCSAKLVNCGRNVVDFNSMFLDLSSLHLLISWTTANSGNYCCCDPSMVPAENMIQTGTFPSKLLLVTGPYSPTGNQPLEHQADLHWTLNHLRSHLRLRKVLHSLNQRGARSLLGYLVLKSPRKKRLRPHNNRRRRRQPKLPRPDHRLIRICIVDLIQEPLGLRGDVRNYSFIILNFVINVVGFFFSGH